MALTITLNQISSTQSPGIAFYSRLKNLSNALVYDTATGTLVATPSSPNISFTESPVGSGSWSWTLNLSTLPDGLYQIDSYESTQNLVAAASQQVYLTGGETRESVALAQVSINHNTGGTDNLRYVDSASNPISGATVRVYTSANWAAQALANPVGVTTTDATGRWVQPIFVTSGATYWIQFSLAAVFGPDAVSVTV